MTAAAVDAAGLRAGADVLRDAAVKLRRLIADAPGESDEGIEEAATYLDDLAALRERQAVASEGGTS